MTIAVVAEKPSVARDIAAVLGASKRGDGFFEGGGHIVTWAIGHLVALAQPHEINPAWKHWSLAALPMLPREFPLVVVPNTKAQFEVVRRILKDRTVERVVCATDAGREGELIFRYVYEAAACRKPVSRLWISSLTPDAIRAGFRNLRSASTYDALADAAKGRSRADWLVGMNLSRAYSLTLAQDISVGRVQTPTLAIVVERELAIRDFAAEDYLEVVATFTPSPGGHEASVTYEGTWFRSTSSAKEKASDPADPRRASPRSEGGDPTKLRRLPPDGDEAARVVDRARSGSAAIVSMVAETRKLPPPLLYDLTELQRHANRLFGLSAQKTLNLAQTLYERHKLLSYPRTDSRHISEDVAATLGAVVDTIASRYPERIAARTGTQPLGRRFVDDSRVTDHHAIIPTATPARNGALSSDEEKIYDLVCRRLLQAWHEDYVYSITTVVTAITSPCPSAIVDRYESRGTAVDRVGWKVLDFYGGKPTPKPTHRRAKADTRGLDEDSDDSARMLPAGLARGQEQDVLAAVAVPKRTRPPRHFTEATLLTAMENAGQTLDEKELTDAMRDFGLGTPATRAQIIETLLRREYLVRVGKSLQATDKGIGLISVVHSEVKSPAMTGEWEAKLKRMQRAEGNLATFMAGIEAYVTEVVARVGKGQVPSTNPTQPRPATPPRGVARLAAPPSTSAATPAPVSRAATPPTPAPVAAPLTTARKPTPPEALRQLLQTAFGFADFRPYQETVCRAATGGHDLLLVMPTGAGKSLCYQLPGIARAGTTLVISPLIALMEDQATKLLALGLRAERIHSGRTRAESRQACIDYLAGRLDFLFIAPERLRIPGFSELLAKRTPTLIAIDEAHCISQWGHDFRPDYRMLGQRLPALRPAPIIALTATATPLVQDDIVTQLGLTGSASFIHGFRRTNIAIEIVEMSPGERASSICKILADKTRRPAIVYAATRKSAEDIGAALGRRLAAAYHAGMDAAERERIQTAFLDDRLEVIVATVAFGMGIDKANVRTIIHAALPGSLEGYYQEIGRAGRDGGPASAILMHAFVDGKTHTYFHGRDYPDVEVLEAIYAKLTKTPMDREKLRAKIQMSLEEFDRALEKLGIHGGAETTPDGEIFRGTRGWAKTYLAQRAHKLEQLRLMARFAESHDCRMVHLVRHFGDQEDDGAPCGLCDTCAPSRSIVNHFREPSRDEEAAISQILSALVRSDEQATGKLYRETFPGGELDRRSFEHLLAGLCRAGLVSVSEASFEKEGKEISYRRATLTPEGRLHGALSTRIALTKETKKPRSAALKAGSTAKAKRRKTAKSRALSKTEPKADGNAVTETPSRGEGKRWNKWFFINQNKRAKRAPR